MTIKISNAELLNALVPGLQELAAIRTNGKIAYNVAKTLKSCDVAVTAFNDQKKLTLEGACEKDEAGKPKIEKDEYVFASPEVKEKVIQDINELIKTEIELDIYPIDITEFQALEGVSAGTILRLGQFVKDELEVVK
jgi:Ser-tRNA(Ala) deacylase AlaX